MSTQTLTAGSGEPKQSSCPIHGLWKVDDAGAGPIKRLGVFAYGMIAYAAFFFTICYGIGFVSGLFVPKTINSGAPGAIIPSLAINTGLLGLFVIQHAVMARPAFKRVITKIIPKAAERSTFVIASSASLLLLYFVWQPMPEVVWSVSNPAMRSVLLALGLSGWAIVFISSFMINHFDLFGLRQVWSNLIRCDDSEPGFQVVGFYKFVRHPLMTGFLIAFWFTPTMTAGHLFFAVMTTAFIVLDVYLLEERDLIAAHGEHYRQYKRSVPGLIPYPKRAR